jgi:hypothetical protein
MQRFPQVVSVTIVFYLSFDAKTPNKIPSAKRSLARKLAPQRSQNHGGIGKRLSKYVKKYSEAQAAFDEFAQQVRHPFDPTESDSIRPNQTNPP